MHEYVQAWHKHSLITHKPHSFITKCMNMCAGMKHAFIDYTQTSQFYHKMHEYVQAWFKHSLNWLFYIPGVLKLFPRRSGWDPNEASKGRMRSQWSLKGPEHRAISILIYYMLNLLILQKQQSLAGQIDKLRGPDFENPCYIPFIILACSPTDYTNAIYIFHLLSTNNEFSANYISIVLSVMFRLCEKHSYPKVPSFPRYWKRKKSTEFGKKTEEHGIS